MVVRLSRSYAQLMFDTIVNSPPTSGSSATAIAGIEDPAGTCIQVVDERKRFVLHGWLLPKSQIRDWLIEGIESRLGVPVSYYSERPDSGNYLALETLYIKNVSTTITGVTVLRVHGSETSLAFRGNQTRMNWGGSDREFSRLLSQSLDAAIVQLPLRALIRQDCPPKVGVTAQPTKHAVGVQ